MQYFQLRPQNNKSHSRVELYQNVSERLFEDIRNFKALNKWIKDMNCQEKCFLLDNKEGMLALLSTHTNIHKTVCRQIISLIKVWQIQKFQALEFPKNNPAYLMSISHINFTKLKGLFIGIQNMKSIEPLSWLQAPSITHIDLGKNSIITTRPLGKTNFIFLKQIRLTSSHTKVQNITRCRTSKEKCIMLLGDKQVCFQNAFKFQSKKSYIIFDYNDNMLVKQKLRLIQKEKAK